MSVPKSKTNELPKYYQWSTNIESIRQNESQRQVKYYRDENYDDVDQAEAKYINNHQQQQHKNKIDVYFPRQGDAISQDFDQQFQNSQRSMVTSNRHDEETREDRLLNQKILQNLLNDKRNEEILLNETIEKQLLQLKHQLQRKDLQLLRCKSIIQGLQKRVSDKEKLIQVKQAENEEKNNEIVRLKKENFENLKLLQKKDDIFHQLTEQTKNITLERQQLENVIDHLKIQNQELSMKIEQLNRNLSIYTQPDRKLFDFKGYGHQQYESPINAKKNSNTDKLQKELERIRKEKSILEIELSAIQQKLEDRENRSRQIEEDNRKKLSAKDKKIQELEQKVAQYKDEVFKNKNQLQANLQKLNSTLNSKNKQIVSLNEKISQNEKRIRSLLEQGKKKDEKVRDLNLQMLEKNKLLNEQNKQLQDMKIKQEFDHHLVAEKDEQIQILIEEKKQLIQQLDIEKSDKRDKLEKVDKAEKVKRERDQEKQKKQYETLRKTIENLQKEKDQTSNNLKECKKKLEQASKQLKAAKASYTQLEASIKSKDAEALTLKQKADKALKELGESKKKADMVPQLRNKIIILENRLKQNESIMKDSCDFSQSSNLQDKIEALQAKLFERDQELKNLKSMIKANSMQTSDEHEEDLQYLQMELEQKEKIIQQLSQEIQEKNEEIEKMKNEVVFKDNTLEFTHKVLVNSEKEKIELQQEKKILEDMISNNSYQGNRKSNQFYDEQIDILQEKIYQLEQRLRNHDEIDREKEYENRQLKLQVKEYKEALLTREKKITPETMSQQETVTFLLKTIKKVNRSADMLRLMAKNRELKDLILRMYQQLKELHL